MIFYIIGILYTFDPGQTGISSLARCQVYCRVIIERRSTFTQNSGSSQRSDYHHATSFFPKKLESLDMPLIFAFFNFSTPEAPCAIALRFFPPFSFSFPFSFPFAFFCSVLDSCACTAAAASSAAICALRPVKLGECQDRERVEKGRTAHSNWLSSSPTMSASAYCDIRSHVSFRRPAGGYELSLTSR